MSERMYRRREVQMKRLILIVIAAFIFVFSGVIVGSGLLDSASSKASRGQASYRYYTSVEVQPGDTLWGIADQYMDQQEYKDTSEYIEELVTLNNLEDSKIHAGQYLTVSYYSSEFK